MDPSFGTNGKVLTDIGIPRTEDYGHDVVAAQEDGKVVVVGSSVQGSTGEDFVVTRYNENGSLDTSFGEDGIVTVDFGRTVDFATGVAWDGSNIVVVGSSIQTGTKPDFAIARLTSAGELDLSYGTGGKKTIDFGSPLDYAKGVALDTGNRIVVAGHSQQSGTGFDFAVARLLSNVAPVADANGPYEGHEGMPLTLTAAGSADPDGDPLHYRWDFESDGTWDTEWLSDPTVAHTWRDDWEGTVTLEVSDGELTATDTASVTILNVAPTPSISGPTSGYEGTAVNLVGWVRTQPAIRTRSATSGRWPRTASRLPMALGRRSVSCPTITPSTW